MKKLLGLILVCAMMVGCGGLVVGCDSDTNAVGVPTMNDEVASIYFQKILKFYADNDRKANENEQETMRREAWEEWRKTQ